MKKLVSDTLATRRGWRESSEMTQMPRRLSAVARKAMRLPSGDQRGFATRQVDVNSGVAGNLREGRSGRCSGWRLVGGPDGKSTPVLAIQSVVALPLPSVVPSV